MLGRITKVLSFDNSLRTIYDEKLVATQIFGIFNHVILSDLLENINTQLPQWNMGTNKMIMRREGFLDLVNSMNNDKLRSNIIRTSHPNDTFL